jgi:SAM-dependent methyltransferase
MTEEETLERIVPGALAADDVTGQATLALHVERYQWAARKMPVGPTLDLACGVGYGSVMLADRHPGVRVIGADISRAALHRARVDHQHPRVTYVAGDGAGWARCGTFEGIVSLETLEHVPDPAALLGELVHALTEHGVLVASVPITPSVDANPHHLTDFTERSFFALGRSLGLHPIDSMRQIQPFSPFTVVTRSERRTRDLRSNLLAYYLRHPSAAWKRLISTMRYGFANHYLTVAWQRGGRKLTQ